MVQSNFLGGNLMEEPKQRAPSTQYLHDRDLIRPGIAITRKSWEAFQRAVDSVNGQYYASVGRRRVSRNSVVQHLIIEWTVRKLGYGSTADWANRW